MWAVVKEPASYQDVPVIGVPAQLLLCNNCVVKAALSRAGRSYLPQRCQTSAKRESQGQGWTKLGTWGCACRHNSEAPRARPSALLVPLSPNPRPSCQSNPASPTGRIQQCPGSRAWQGERGCAGGSRIVPSRIASALEGQRQLPSPHPAVQRQR